MDSIKIFFPSQLVHAPPVQLGFPSIHSFLKEHSQRASPSLETGAKTDPGLGDDIENEVDISTYGKEVRMQENFGAAAWWLYIFHAMFQVDLYLFRSWTSDDLWPVCPS